LVVEVAIAELPVGLWVLFAELTVAPTTTLGLPYTWAEVSAEAKAPGEGDWLAPTIDADSSAVVALPPSINVPDKLPAVRVSVPEATAEPPSDADMPSESGGLAVWTIVVALVEDDELPVELVFVAPDTVEEE
jgi:hypothetical protein